MIPFVDPDIDRDIQQEAALVELQLGRSLSDDERREIRTRLLRPFNKEGVSLSTPLYEDSHETLADRITRIKPADPIVRRQKKGNYSYSRVLKKANCENCGNCFVYLTKPKRGRVQKFCSLSCRSRATARRKLPDGQTLYHHYWIEGLSLTDIARKYGAGVSTVTNAMKHANIARRNRRTAKQQVKKVKQCIEVGCDRKAQPKLHTNGYLYGRRCSFHQRLHIAANNREYMRRIYRPRRKKATQ